MRMLLSLSTAWVDCDITEESIQRFVKWYIANEKNPAFVKAAKELKSFHVGNVPSAKVSTLMGVVTNTKALWVNPMTTWGKTQLTDLATTHLTHELGHIIWSVVGNTAEGKAFAKAAMEEAAKGKFISDYHETHFSRLKAKKSSEFVFVHEAFAEWCAKGPSNRDLSKVVGYSGDVINAREMPKQYAAFLAALKKY